MFKIQMNTIYSDKVQNTGNYTHFTLLFFSFKI